jgi:pyruvate dehydrogenase E1 component
MKALPLSISRWVPGPYVVLGTDGYGLSESRSALREHFEVIAEYIAYAALAALRDEDRVDDSELEDAANRLNIDRTKPDPTV